MSITLSLIWINSGTLMPYLAPHASIYTVHQPLFTTGVWPVHLLRLNHLDLIILRHVMCITISCPNPLRMLYYPPVYCNLPITIKDVPPQITLLEITNAPRHPPLKKLT